MTMRSAAAGSEPSETRRLRIDLWSDIGCPWCYIGKKRLETAVAASPYAIEVVPRSFELDPTMGDEPEHLLEFLAQKLGVSVPQASQLDDQVGALARAEGLRYTADRVQANTFDTHRVLHLAADHGLANELLTTLQRELFGGRADVYGHPFLAEAAAELGIPSRRVAEVLAGEEYADAVRADEDEARRLGITGVPFAVVDGRFGIPGAVTVDGYTKAIEHALEQE